MASMNDVSYPILPTVQFTTSSMSAGTMSALWITGAQLCILNNTGATPGTQTTRTAALMIADSNLVQGQQWWILFINSVTTNAMTLAAGSGVTLAGTTTCAGFSERLYTALVTSTTTPAITITGIYTRTYVTSIVAAV